MLAVALILMAAAAVAPAAAQGSDSRYSSNWGTPPSQAVARPGGDSAAQRLVDQLNRLVDQAEKARAADPVFLRDLRELARRYDWPWSVRVVHDDWADGNVTANPAWRVDGAPVSVDPRYGLRTTVAAVAPLAPTPAGRSEEKPADVAAQLFGQILRQATKDRNGDAPPPAAQPAATAADTTLVSTAAIPNAFALELDLAVNARPAAGDTGRIELGAGQGAGATGYRLAAIVDAGTGPAAGSTLELLRVGARGTTVAERVATKVDLADGAIHRLQLTRDRAGGMRLLVDGAVVAQLADRAFTDGFDRLVVVNRGGDWTLRSVAAYGVP